MREIIVYLTLVVVLASFLSFQVYDQSRESDFYEDFSTHRARMSSFFSHYETLLLCNNVFQHGDSDAPFNSTCQVYHIGKGPYSDADETEGEK